MLDVTKKTEEYKEVEIIETNEGTIEKPKVEKVVTTPVKKRKKGLVERGILALIGPEGLPKVGKKINNDIVVPTLKTLLVDSLTTLIQNMVWKNDSGVPRNNYYRDGSNYSYNQINTQRVMYNSNINPNVTEIGSIYADGRVPEYSVSTRNEAISVIDIMQRQIALYGICTVADYYDALGIDSDFTASSFGWRDLSLARVVPTTGGFLIQLPPVHPIN